MKKERILIVDDEKEIRDLVEIYLKGEGYETLKAKDGEEALYLLKGNDIDLVISFLFYLEINILLNKI